MHACSGYRLEQNSVDLLKYLNSMGIRTQLDANAKTLQASRASTFTKQSTNEVRTCISFLSTISSCLNCRFVALSSFGLQFRFSIVTLVFGDGWQSSQMSPSRSGRLRCSPTSLIAEGIPSTYATDALLIRLLGLQDSLAGRPKYKLSLHHYSAHRRQRRRTEILPFIVPSHISTLDVRANLREFNESPSLPRELDSWADDV